MIKVSGFYKARKKERQQTSRKEPTPILVAVLGPQQSPVVMQSQSEEGEGIQEVIHVREEYLVTETMYTKGRVMGSRDTREDFEERIEEIDRDLKKFDNDELSKPDTDMVRILGEAISNKHAKKLDSD